MVTLDHGNIRLNFGNTFDFTIILDAKYPDGSPYAFTIHDYIRLSIRDKSGEELYKYASKITNNRFTFAMTNTESEAIPVGRFCWDFTIYTQAVLDDTGFPIDGHFVVTPFYHPADFICQEIASHE
ncbi:hypothetical protein LQZ19_08815 [Treponema primitia]|uniref:hypothetical protein n=1 Tax=Treponema primitia TaxID=88058 RepID=UPI00397F1C96